MVAEDRCSQVAFTHAGHTRIEGSWCRVHAGQSWGSQPFFKLKTHFFNFFFETFLSQLPNLHTVQFQIVTPYLALV